ncbi:MAG: hypothetical protein KDK39_03750 [Leptospiraceae bacterium]|nr:hypothetical protein [Leptospiraceae bacterium]
MRRTTLLVALLLATTLQLNHCSAQAEESTDDLTFEEQALQAALFSAGLVDLGGLYWQGEATMDACTAITVDAAAYCATMISQGQQIQQETVHENIRILFTSQAGVNVSTKTYLIMPHFNGYPFGYEVQMAGTVNTTKNLADYNLTLAQTAVSINPNVGYNIAVNSFIADKTEGELKGSFTVVLSSAAVNGDATLNYHFAAKRSY